MDGVGWYTVHPMLEEPPREARLLAARGPQSTTAEAPERTPAAAYCPAKPEGLALGELEPATRARLTVLLALDGAGITREEAGLLEGRTEVRVVVAQRAGEAVADGAGLTTQTSATHVDLDVDLALLLEHIQGLVEHHLGGLAAEVHVDVAAVDDHNAGARADPHARGGLLAAAGAIKALVGGGSHVVSSLKVRKVWEGRSPYASTSRATGCCAVCGCVSPA